MAVEIREIGIKMRVAETRCADAGDDAGGQAGAVDVLSDHDRAAIVDDCVRRVISMLRARRER